MMGQQKMWVWLVVAAVAACDVDEAPLTAADLDGVSPRELEVNGLRLNGFRLNGFRLNGFRLNGFRLNGDAGSADFIDLESIEIAPNITVAYSWLAGSELRVTTTTGAVLAGEQLEGAILNFGLVDSSESSHYKVRKIKVVDVIPPQPGDDVWHYNLQVKDNPGAWQPLCLTDLGMATEAILIADAWNPATGARIAGPVSDLVTLACRDAAIGKCVEWGYHPWELGDYHDACTRLVRADYCGDGTAHTVDGLTIHVLDEIGVQEAEPGSTYAVEAEWGPDGATCLNESNTRLSAPSLDCELPACDEPFASGGLIQTGVVLP